jgi:RimJ/RimL family protein N-acetyltransferase
VVCATNIEMIKIPTITTSRIALRAYGEGDVPQLHQILLNPNILRYFPPSVPPTLDKVQKLVEIQWEHWKEYGYGWWALAMLDTDRLMGWCGLNFLPETGEVELKYLLAQEYWGKGIATEASRASLLYAVTETDLDLIIGLVHPENIASQKVLEKVGMSFIEQKQYFGMECLRFAIGRERLEMELLGKSESVDF